MFTLPLADLTQSTRSLSAVAGSKRDTKMSTVRTVSTLFTVRLVAEVPKTGGCFFLTVTGSMPVYVVNPALVQHMFL